MYEQIEEYINSDFSDNVITEINEDDDIDCELLKLQFDDFFEEEILNETYENVLGMISQKALKVDEGVYSLEDLFKVEPGLDKFISNDILKDSESLYENTCAKIDMHKFEKLFDFGNEILPEYNMEKEEFSLEGFYDISTEGMEEASARELGIIEKADKKT